MAFLRHPVLSDATFFKQFKVTGSKGTGGTRRSTRAGGRGKVLFAAAAWTTGQEGGEAEKDAEDEKDEHDSEMDDEEEDQIGEDDDEDEGGKLCASASEA